jgi:hypothetical protein
VIVNRAASISSLIRSSGCGVAVEYASDIGAALGELSVRYDAVSNAACGFFETHLNFRRAFDEVLRRIDAIPEAA